MRETKAPGLLPEFGILASSHGFPAPPFTMAVEQAMLSVSPDVGQEKESQQIIKNTGSGSAF